NLSFARIGSVLESQFRAPDERRQSRPEHERERTAAAAWRNLEAALQDAGLVGHTIEEVHREANGYSVRVSKAGHVFMRSGLDEGILEDAWSDTRRRLAEEARRDLDRSTRKTQEGGDEIDHQDRQRGHRSHGAALRHRGRLVV